MMMVSSSSSGGSAAVVSSSPFQAHWDLYPRQYEAPFTVDPPKVIDGNIFKEEWDRIPWSCEFDDIRGPQDAPPSDRPSMANRTRMKVMWDDHYLYMAALLESDEEIRATFHRRNSPIYQQDSDFEVFLDATSSCHNYKEFEVNAYNTVWNLMLDKPYWDGGIEHSGRIAQPGEPNYYDVQDQITAVQLMEGQLNTAPAACDCKKKKKCRNVWSVEMAFSHADSLRFQSSSSKRKQQPKVGDFWRLNLSRVEKKGLINWTWQPQRIWDPTHQKHMGKVDMHLPDAWGYLHFVQQSTADDNKTTTLKRDPHWPCKLTLMNIYYAQKRYKELHHQYASSLQELHHLLDPNLLQPFLESNDYTIELQVSSSSLAQSYTATIHNRIHQESVSITYDRLITITTKSTNNHINDNMNAYPTPEE